MREIKFRAWDNKTKSYLNIDKFLGTSPQFNGYVDVIKYGFGLMVDICDTDIEVELFIDITDKNKREIYDGDIVKGHARKSIEYQISNNKLHEYSSEWDEDFIGVVSSDIYRGTSFGSFPAIYCRNIEVIGNIHENPELVK